MGKQIFKSRENSERKRRSVGRQKALAVFLLAAVLLLTGAGVFPEAESKGILPVWAAESEDLRWVYDQAGLFSEEEEAELEKELSAMRKETGMDLVLVTAKDAKGKTAEEYADDFYDENGFGNAGDEGGILYLIDMDNRELYISTDKNAIRLLTDQRVDRMLEKGVAYLAEEDYMGCAKELLRNTWEYYKQGIPEGQYNQDRDTGKVSYYQEKPKRSIRWYEALLALAVSAFCAGSVCRRVKRDYAMEKERGMGSGYHMAYRADTGFRFRNQRDQLTDSHITRQVIPRSQPRRPGGGSHSGRSTTHVSRGGRTHGGGGRRF